MIRDFTEETLNEFLDKVKIDSLDGVIDNAEFTKEVAGENCVLNVPEINNYVKNIKDKINYHFNKYETYEEVLKKIFKDARSMDEETGEKVVSKVEEVMDPYKESMEQLINCIDVSAWGDTESKFKYNKDNYTPEFDNSVFGSPGNYIKKIHEVKGGAFKRLLNSVNDYENNEEELENLKKLINMDSSEFDIYEAAVLLALFNNCIGYSGTTTNSKTNRAEIGYKNEIDYEKLSYLVTLCYEEKDEKGVKKVQDTTKYSLSPNINKFSEYYDNYYKNIYYSKGGITSKVTPYANINSILKNICEYFPEVETQPTYAYAHDKYAYEDGLGRWYKDFGIDINEEEVKDEDGNSFQTITISTNENSTSNNKTYILKMYDNECDEDKFKKALKVSDENLKVNTLDKTMKATAEGGTSFVISKIPGISTAKDIYDLISGPVKAHKESVQYNENLDKNQNDITLNDYVSKLGMDYNVSINKDTISYNNLTYNENELKIRVAYYNGVKGNTGKDAITTEDAKHYFQEYLDGDSTHMSDFYNTLTPSDNIPNKNYDGNSIDDFKEIVSKKLDDNVTTSTATPEQMEEAIRKTMSEYETGKYRDAVDSPLDLEEDH